jgi:hypothetical protein
MMKWIIFILCLITFSCKSLEYTGISSDGKLIYYNGELVGELEQIEYEYYQGKRVVEISIKQFSPGMTDVTLKITDFILSKYPNAKVEVKPRM